MQLQRHGSIAFALGHRIQFYSLWLIFVGVAIAKPQDMKETIAFGAAQIAAQAANIASNGGAFFDDRGFEGPFVKAHSKTAAGMGEAIVQRDDSDSSEEDRRKRSIDDNFFNFFHSESRNEREFLFPLPHFHDRAKRSPCWTGGGGSGGGGTGGTEGTGGADDVDVVSERRKLAARKRKAAQQKKRTNANKKNAGKTKKRLVGDGEETPEERRRKRNAEVNTDISQKTQQISDQMQASLKKFAIGISEIAQQLKQGMSRRKRQAEVDDLNAGMDNAKKDFSEHARQIAEKVRAVIENVTKAINDMAQRVKQSIVGGSQSNNEVDEI